MQLLGFAGGDLQVESQITDFRLPNGPYVYNSAKHIKFL